MEKRIKKNIGIIVCICVLFCRDSLLVDASERNVENDYTELSIEVQETDGLREEILSPQILSQIFPEYKELILQNNVQKSKRMVMSEEDSVIDTVKKRINEDIYLLNVYESGKYVAISLTVDAKLSNGERTVGSNYVRHSKKILTILERGVGVNVILTVTNLSFTIRQYTYDILETYDDFVTCIETINGTVETGIGRLNTYGHYETATNPAYAQYYSTTHYLKFWVQNNKWGVIYDGTNYNIGSEY